MLIAEPKIASMLDRTKAVSVTCPVTVKVGNSVYTTLKDLYNTKDASNVSILSMGTSLKVKS